MPQKKAQFQIKGMTKDIASSKVSSEYAFDIRNMRLVATEDNSTYVLTNERGTLDLEIPLTGHILGQVDTKDGIVVFTHSDDEDRIYYIYINEAKNITWKILYHGNLKFNINNPIDAIASYENESTEKIYWTDGINYPRLINIKKVDKDTGFDTQFDFIPEIKKSPIISVSRISSSLGMFPAGTIQYCFTYSKKLGQETGIIWSSEILYIVNNERGLTADETSQAAYIIIVSNLDNSFDYLNLYSIIRTSEDAAPIVKRVTKYIIPTSTSAVFNYVDTNTTGEIVDSTSLLFKGSGNFKAKYIGSKDNTLFLGNLETIDYTVDFNIGNYLKNYHGEITYQYRELQSDYSKGVFYQYQTPSSINNEIKYLKKDNYYRIGVQLQNEVGQWSEPLFIEDKKATASPKFENNKVYIPYYVFKLDEDIIGDIFNKGYKAIRPVIVFPDKTKRTVIAQGITSPTIGRGDKRSQNSPWAQASWIFRPYNPRVGYFKANYADQGNISAEARHLHVLPGSSHLNCEIQGVNDNIEYTAQTTSDNYFIDQSLLTFHTPELSNLSQGDLEGAKLRVVGYFFIDSVSGRFTLDAKDKKAYYSKGADYSKYVYKGAQDEFAPNKTKVENLFLTRPLWNDIHSYLTYPWHKNGALNDSLKDGGVDNPQTGILQRKVISNIRVSYQFDYLTNPWLAQRSDSVHNGITTPKFNEGDVSSVSIINMNTDSINEAFDSNFTYYGGRDEIFVATEQGMWKQSGTEFVETDNKESFMVPIKYKSTKHLVFSFNNYNVAKSALARTLPVPFFKNSIIDENKYPTSLNLEFWLNHISIDPVTASVYRVVDNVEILSTIDADHFEAVGDTELYAVAINSSTCKIYEVKKTSQEDTRDITLLDVYDTRLTDLDSFEVRMSVDVPDFILSNDDIGKVFVAEMPYQDEVSVTHNLFSSLPSNKADSIVIDKELPTGVNEVMWIVELYRDISDAKLVFGDSNNKWEMSHLKWIPAGKSLPITGQQEIELEITTGDSMFNRWDCLKTYAATPTDINSMVEIMSFMCESYTDTQGRYDINRGLLDNTFINDSNFNLFNPVYNTTENYFTSRVLDSATSKITKYPTQLTWSLVKTPGEEIDTWANISLSSILDVDGDKGEITALKNINNSLLCFQPKGISEILYNESVQISSTEGVPIEIANSGKVQGKRYISNTIGCSNKDSIYVTPKGLYFVDYLTKGLYLYGGNGIVNLSDMQGFHSWANKNIVDNNTLIFYDKINNEILFTRSNEVLAYSEYLEKFTSFYDYKNLKGLHSLQNETIAFEHSQNNTNIWGYHKGNYNYLFNEYAPFNVTVIVNQEPMVDKIFNNIEFTSDSWNNNTLINSTFDTLDAWNEYQEGHLSLANIRNKPSALKKKFRMWRANIPRNNTNKCGDNTHNYKRDRMRNPWLYLKLSMNTPNTNKTVLHDIIVDYFV